MTIAPIHLSLASDTIALKTLPPLALYVHIPWCARKCPYCDFNSHEIPSSAQQGPNALDQDLEQRYIAALVTDLEHSLPLIWGRRVVSIFIGGGTPSLLSARALDELLCAIRARLQLAPDAEITLEANPGTFEAEKFRAFRAAGVNRLSIGIQSFNPRYLKSLGRIHDDVQARAAIEIALREFDNFNLDLMYALPGQSVAEAIAEIEMAADFGPRHISAYHLTIEPNTVFAKYPPIVPDDDTSADMQEGIEAALQSRGYRHYETSAFGKPGFEARHNLNYWSFGDYIGIGAGAHGKISFPDRILRQERYRAPRDYLSHVSESAVSRERVINVGELPFEFMMNALRLNDGFELRLYEERTGLSLQRLQSKFDALDRDGLIERDHLRLRPTRKGQRFLNDLLQRFLD
jgi:putative oxygen-independent coproporphyrinogen III oxidase